MVIVTVTKLPSASTVYQTRNGQFGVSGQNRKKIRAFGGFKPLVSDTAVEAKDFPPPAALC